LRHELNDEGREVMNAPTKPRYRLGTQNMLDLAEDDARLIPENTLFIAKQGNDTGSKWSFLNGGELVVRCINTQFGQDGQESVRFAVVSSEAELFHPFGYAHAGMLRPFL
jgi:hypothetical protein